MAIETDWNMIKAFYLQTRSIKATAEKFGIATNTVKARAHREGWARVGGEPEGICNFEGADAPRNGTAEGASESAKGADAPRNGTAEGASESAKGADAPRNGSDSPENSTQGACSGAKSGTSSETGAEDWNGAAPNGTTPEPKAAPSSNPALPLFCLVNLSESRVERARPWAFGTGTMPQGMTKPEFRAWCADSKTRDLFYSGFEGANAALRVSDNNPATFMHGLVADYDVRVPLEERHAFLARASLHHPPNFISATFSGGVRLVWLFEGPIPLFTKRITGVFITRLKKELNLRKAFPALDEEALARPGQYYQRGHHWEALSPTPLSLDLLHAWVLAASKKGEWSSFGDEVPIARVAEAVEQTFPGRWHGPFEIGARGPRFWDETASNPTSAIVRSSGMQCFTGSRPFVPWIDILGRKFMDEFQASTAGAAISAIWFDGRDYWLKIHDAWRLFKKGDVALHLRVEHDISDERRKGVVATPMDQILNQIHQTKAVDGAAPFVYRDATIIHFSGKRYLNIARARLMAPAEESQAWGENFPYIAALLDGYFDPPEQLPFFLSWLAFAYQAAAKGKPHNGQATFIAGDVNQGKTLISNVLVGDLFGGHMDASDYLLGESKFNKELFEVGLWTVDDTVPSSDPRRQQLYSAMLKKIPANYSFQYHPKFRDAIMLPWAGRVLITCNADPESIRILPDTEMSLLDKVMLFKVRTAERDFKDAAARIRAELPFFARFILDYQIPEHCRGEARFGVKCYHHEELIEEARQSSRTAGFAELLEIFRRSFFANGSTEEWEGNATELKQAMLSDDAVKALADAYSVEMIGRLLGKLESQQYPGLSRPPRRGYSRLWRICRVAVPPENCPF